MKTWYISLKVTLNRNPTSGRIFYDSASSFLRMHESYTPSIIEEKTEETYLPLTTKVLETLNIKDKLLGVWDEDKREYIDRKIYLDQRELEKVAMTSVFVPDMVINCSSGRIFYDDSRTFVWMEREDFTDENIRDIATAFEISCNRNYSEFCRTLNKFLMRFPYFEKDIVSKIGGEKISAIFGLKDFGL